MVYLYNFDPQEFKRNGTNWFPKTCPRLLVLMDILRFRLGSIIHISGHRGAVGRKRASATTQHNVELYGQVRAIDFFVEGVYCRAQAEEVVREMRGLGFTGIGVYADWTNNRGEKQVGFHGDTRRGSSTDAEPGNPAEWGKASGKWTSLMQALQNVPKAPS